MGRQFIEFELQSIDKGSAASLKTKDEVSIWLEPQGTLQVLVRLSHHSVEAQLALLFLVSSCGPLLQSRQDTLCLQTSNGQHLGDVPSEKYSQIPKQACTGSIRSIRRAPQGGEVHQILVRINAQHLGIFVGSKIAGLSNSHMSRSILCILT